MSGEIIANTIDRIWQRIVRELESILSYLIKKKKNLWLYYPVHFKAVTGDCIFLFDYVNKNDNQIQQYILVDRKFLVKDSNYNRYIIDRYSLKGLYLSLRAKVIIIDADGPFRKGVFNIVQLWHGTGYKNIVALSGQYNLQYNKKRLKNVCFVAASSDADKERKARSFLTSRVYLTGSPRNDFFYSKNAQQIIQELRQALNISEKSQVILYAPTYRSKLDFCHLSKKFFDQFENLAKENDLIFLIKKHPKDNTVYDLTKYSMIRDITTNQLNVQELLLLSDLLITDYSSIASDFSLLDRPIIFYTYDFEKYIQSQRGFYYDLRKVLPGPFARTENDLLYLLTNPSWSNDETYKDKFKSFQRIFHKFKDGNSSKRVYSQIFELIEKNEI